MHGIMQLAVLALATASAMAHTVDLKFIRFSQPNCEGNNHIGDDVHLHNSNCKDFKEAEAPFESFSTTEEKDEGYTSDKICEVTAYKEHNCKGQGWTMGGTSMLPVFPKTCSPADGRPRSQIHDQ